MAKRFQLRPVSGLPEELRSVFEGIELFLNTALPDVEGGSAPAWTNVSYSNGWATQSGEEAASYYKHNGIVRLRGVMTGASATAITAFTLPAGYRPVARGRFPLSYWDGSKYVAGAIVVKSDGTVDVEDNTASAGVASTTTFVGLSVVSFRAV